MPYGHTISWVVIDDTRAADVTPVLRPEEILGGYSLWDLAGILGDQLYEYVWTHGSLDPEDAVMIARRLDDPDGAWVCAWRSVNPWIARCLERVQ